MLFNNMMIYSFYMFFIFLVSFIFGLFLFFSGKSFLLEWLFYSINSVNMEFFILIDWVSLIFISVVMLISSMVMIYSIWYMEDDKNIMRFYLLVIMFIISMIFMIVSPSLISILLGWDGLGLVSYCLVIYYQNYSSFNSGMVTVLSNRLGDVGLLMCISLMLIYGSWNMWLLEKENFLMIFMIFLAAITKSAQIPFSYWLPQAMAAPTPISSLVHSSTLVTAGVYLLIRFNEHLCQSGMNYLLLYLSTLTSFMSGLMANFEYDLKKIVALSTLSQLGLMMMILSINLSDLALFHLLTHALFKSLLFLCSGVIIHLMMNNQDIRFYGSLNEFMPFIMMSFYIATMALCGIPFMSGFYSKDLIMEMFYLNIMNVFLIILAILSISMTVSYSFRLMYYVYFGGSVSFYFSSFLSPSNSSFLLNFSMIMMLGLSVCSGSMISWLIFFDFYESFMSVSIKMLTLGACLIGMMLGLMFYLVNFLKFYYFSYFMSSMWMMMFFYTFIYRPMINYWELSWDFDKTWVEFSSKFSFLLLVESFKNFKKSHYKIYMMVYLIFFISLMFFLF
nr:TPA_asm: NADH dehydrogenase subunit 5 [Tetraponera aethiops]